MESQSSFQKDPYFEFVKALPKVELHAHLNGSLSWSTLDKLYRMKHGCNAGCPEMKKPNTLSECFDIFKLIHNITDTPESIFQATCDVIQDFYSDGVRYLELRSTPRETPGIMTLQSYVQSVVAAIKKCEVDIPNSIIVKFLLSIDRKNPVKLAEETVKLAEENLLSNDVVVGVDLSGNPEVGDASHFIPVLQYAKKAGLKLALHIAEIPGRDKEVEDLLQLPPDRIGHGTYIHPNNGGKLSNYNSVRRQKIPLEMCLTSNVISGTAVCFKDHHFGMWYSDGHPCILCTDDKGVFKTSLSNEYYITRKHFGLKSTDLWNISYHSINYCFAWDEVKEYLKKLWETKKLALLNHCTPEL